MRLPTAEGINPGIAEPCRDQRTRERMRGFIRDVEAARASEGALRLATASGDPECLLQEGSARVLGLAFESVQGLGLQQTSPASLRNLLDRVRDAERTLNEAGRCYAAVQALLGSELAFSMDSVDLILRCLRLIESAPAESLHIRTSALEDEAVRPLLRVAANEARAVGQRHIELDTQFDLGLAREIADLHQLKEHARAIGEASFWQVWFGSAYRRAAKTHRRIVRVRSRQRQEIMSRELRMIADHLHRRAQFESYQPYRDALGPHFRGVETPWDDVLALVAWYEDVLISLPAHGHHFRDLLLRTRAERLKGIRGQLAAAAADRGRLERLQEALPGITGILPQMAFEAQSIPDLAASLGDMGAQIEGVLLAFAKVGLRDDLPCTEIPSLLDTAQRYGVCMARIVATQDVQQLLRSAFAGVNTDLSPLRATVDFAEAVSNSGLPEETKQWILCNECVTHLERMRSWLSEAHALGGKLTDAAKAIRALAASSDGPACEGKPLESLLTKSEQALERREELPRWLHFVGMRGAAKDQSIDRLTTLADRWNNRIDIPCSRVPVCFL